MANKTHRGFRLILLAALVIIGCICVFGIDSAISRIVEIPDPNLRQAISEVLDLPASEPITQQEMETLTKLEASRRGIINLTGLENATNLRSLELQRNPISDITVFAHLTNLIVFNLWGCQISDISALRNLTNLRSIVLGNNQISDISPLAGLTNLTTLQLHRNQIVDFSPLANLTNLEKLHIEHNLGTDFTPLQGLDLIEFYYDQVCDMPPLGPSVIDRIENRTFPSIFRAWDDVLGLDHLKEEQRKAIHDLHFSPSFEHNIYWDKTLTEPTHGVSTQRAGNLELVREIRQRRLDHNPNVIFLRDVRIHNHFDLEAFPPDSDFWIRESQNEVITNAGGEYLFNFLNPEVQEILIKRILAIERCGLYDGIMLDGFNHNGTGFVGRQHYAVTDEDIIQAMLNIFREVRSQARDDFLILINTNRSKATRYTEYVNGTFMETLRYFGKGYSRDGLKEIESTLLWSESNLRYPQINCLEGWGIPSKPPDSPENRRWMRVFTTMSLTHSDGYVMYNTGWGAITVCPECPYWGPGHEHIWYDFWDANLGRPVGPKAQVYDGKSGLFVREFTNGWAVYNRSGSGQTVILPLLASPVSERDGVPVSKKHQLPDLDGEIYLTSKSFADVNRDGKVNVLDLVQVANKLGKVEPDLNGDGVVNILDLVLVANNFE